MTASIARPMAVKLDPDTRARLAYVVREEKRETFRSDTLKA